MLSVWSDVGWGGQEVSRFFSSRHYGHFVVTNLCNAFEEGGNGNYDQALLYNQVPDSPALCSYALCGTEADCGATRCPELS